MKIEDWQSALSLIQPLPSLRHSYQLLTKIQAQRWVMKQTAPSLRHVGRLARLPSLPANQDQPCLLDCLPRSMRLGAIC